MTLKHPSAGAPEGATLSVPPLFTGEAASIPRHELPSGGMGPDVAYH
jgi:hypothetical protein